MTPERADCITRKHELAYSLDHVPYLASRNEYADTLPEFR